jgi:hypothetical protein
MRKSKLKITATKGKSLVLEEPSASIRCKLFHRFHKLPALVLVGFASALFVTSYTPSTPAPFRPITGIYELVLECYRWADQYGTGDSDCNVTQIMHRMRGAADIPRWFPCSLCNQTWITRWAIRLLRRRRWAEKHVWGKSHHLVCTV